MARPRPAAAPSEDSARRRTAWLLGAGLGALALLVYAGALTHDFIAGYDDSVYVLANGPVKQGLTIAGLRWAFTTFHAANWHPLTWISHMLDVQLFGLAPWGHHLTSVALHAVNVVLLFWVFAGATGRLGPSAFVAALFAVHPLHVESVAWVAERKDVLSGLFGLLTVVAYLRYARAPRGGNYALVLIFFALGLMSKPMLVSLPLALLLLDYWPIGRLGGNAATDWRRLLAEKAPLFVMTVASCIVTLAAQRRGGAVAGSLALPILARLGNALLSYAKYIGLTLWPHGLAAYYPYVESPPVWQPVAAGAAAAGVTALVLRFGRTRRYLVTGWFWYLVTLVPVIGLVQVGAQSMADRYMYLPSIGLFVLAAWGAPDLAVRFLDGWRTRAALAGLAVIVALAFGAAAAVQARTWRNAVALWTHAVAVTTDNQLAQVNLAAALDREGRLAEASPHYGEAVRIRPDDVQARNDFGGALARLGRFDDARRELQEVLQRAPRLTDAHFNLGYVDLQQNRLDEAIAEFSAALQLSPQDQRARQNLVAAHKRLALEQGRQGLFERAAANLEEALRLDLADVDARINLGVTRSRQGRDEDARREYEAALALDPRSPTTHSNLAAALYRLGRYDEAWRHVRLCREYGGRPPDSLVDALSRREREPR